MQPSTAPSTALAGTPASTRPPVLQIEDLSVEFLTEHGWVTVIDSLSLTIGEGESVGLVGESGSGKSVTSLAAMALIKHPGRVSGGHVTLDGVRLDRLSWREMEDVRGKKIAMIFQEPMTSLNPSFTVGEQIAEVVRRHDGLSRKQAAERAVNMLDTVGIPRARERARAYPHEFSGGMRQRVMIGMALACSPRMLIADEPTTALDVTTQIQILDLLHDLRAEFGMALLFISHDLGVIADIADRVAVMYAGQLVETASADELFARPSHPYTRGLMRSMPRADEATETFFAIPGAPPAPWDFPSGCRFAPRCSMAGSDCTQGPIPLIPVGAADAASRCLRTTAADLEGPHL
ncbi:ABC transporter ATP-binding protein [Acrocarpospora macrocephala]|uniref:Peptide ABC transporter ATP-binding protein n=1 Tax=Acrocarpospora macrocephala TaxID=150177 RepID=A0A5M3WL37_9ACTN|nr:ABC transporter ATP-binding protein [Acrocarpospora macrocephala]GES09366.1 peptide ABC transporter ATP-binding protein [Acrocarpospora macrocephala]